MTALHPDDDRPWPPPRETGELAGQGAAERALAAAYASGRMPHAWLLTGPRGVGKATLAFRFAKFVLSGGGGGLFGAAAEDGLAVAAGHPVARRVAALAHPDLAYVRRSFNAKNGRWRTEISVEDVRDLSTFLHLTPAEGGWRMAIVDSADDMNENAANALLKALEEPPRRAVLLLIGHAPGRLLPTIRSRCRILPLHPLDAGTVAALLERLRPETARDDRAVLAAFADGSIGRALELAEAGGAELYRDLLALLSRLPALDATALHAFADQTVKSGGGGEAQPQFRTLVELMAGWVQRLVRVGAGAPPAEEAAQGEQALFARLAAGPGLDRWVSVWDKLARLPGRTEGLNLDRRQTLVDALLAIEDAARNR